MPLLEAGVWQAHGELKEAASMDDVISLGLGDGISSHGGIGIDNAVPDLAARVVALLLDEKQGPCGTSTHPAYGVGGSESGFN